MALAVTRTPGVAAAADDDDKDENDDDDANRVVVDFDEEVPRVLGVKAPPRWRRGIAEAVVDTAAAKRGAAHVVAEDMRAVQSGVRVRARGGDGALV